MLQNSSDGDNTRFLMWEKILGPNFNYWTASGGEKKRLKRRFAAALGTKPWLVEEDGLGFFYGDTLEKITAEDMNRARNEIMCIDSKECDCADPFVWGPMKAPLDCCTATVASTPYKSESLYDDLEDFIKPTPKTNAQIKKDNNMRNMYNDNVSAPTASVNIKADAEFSPEKVAQDHLLSRLMEARWSKRHELEKTYHLYSDGTPATIKEMLERVKAGDYKFDSDYKDEYVLSREFEEYDSPFRFFDWRKFPKDQAGFDKAAALMEKAYEEAVDTVKVLGSKEGLTALRAFEAQSFTVN